MITDATGTYRFDNVDTEGFYTVTPSRANYTFSPANRSFSVLGHQTEAEFSGSATSDAANPLDTAEYFVRQQYLDVLGREPDEGGFNYWSDQIIGCGADLVCVNGRRRDVAAAFFIEREFQRTGSFIYGLYNGGLGRQPMYQEFVNNRRQIMDGENLETAKNAVSRAFVQQSEFVSKYQAQTTGEAFVDRLLLNVLETSGVNLKLQRDEFLNQYSSGTNIIESRAAVVRAVSEAPALQQTQYNSAFVLTEYFSYLRRDPDQGGYLFWLDVLNNREANNYRGMVCAFTTSPEFQQRFSRIISRSNADCGP